MVAWPSPHRICPTRDRLAVHATDHARAVELVRAVLAEVGPTYRPLGEPALIDALTAGIPGLRPVRDFGWMDRPAWGASLPGTAEWLPPDFDQEIAALLDLAFPGSDARPGRPGVERWAGIRGDDGALLAVAALAWSAPDIGFLSGVAAHPRTRGKGLASQVSGFIVREALAVHSAVALMVDDGNTPAVRLYERLGLSRRTVRAAAIE
jgi:Predicted acetyltransferase